MVTPVVQQGRLPEDLPPEVVQAVAVDVARPAAQLAMTMPRALAFGVALAAGRIAVPCSLHVGGC